jgi:hypothetical protein
MLGSAKDEGTPFEQLPTGASGLYVVTARPDESTSGSSPPERRLSRRYRTRNTGGGTSRSAIRRATCGASVPTGELNRSDGTGAAHTVPIPSSPARTRAQVGTGSGARPAAGVHQQIHR